MTFLSKSKMISRQNGNIWQGTKIVITSVVALGLPFSAPMPASAMPTTEADGSYSSRLNRLRSLQVGARRAQHDRLQQAQTRWQTNPAQPESPALNHRFPSGDGVYLYGEHPVYDRPATAYFVFEVSAENVTGAFYTPASSFDCARGRIDSDSIQLTITDSYSQTSHQYALGLNPVDAQLASQQNVTLPQEIEGYYALPARDRDHAILATCQAQ